MENREKSLVQMNSDELTKINNSIIENSIYQKYEETIDEPIPIDSAPIPYWKQRVECKFCGDNVSKAHYSKHRRTVKCKIYQDMNEKIRYLIIK